MMQDQRYKQKCWKVIYGKKWLHYLYILLLSDKPNKSIWCKTEVACKSAKKFFAEAMFAYLSYCLIHKLIWCKKKGTSKTA